MYIGIGIAPRFIKIPTNASSQSSIKQKEADMYDQASFLYIFVQIQDECIATIVRSDLYHT